MGVESQVTARTPVYYLDFKVKTGGSYSQSIPEGWTTFVYTLDGKIKLGKLAIDF
jgi:redox-sensitive bicupin YhaK (pirin superfamily)